MDTSFWITLYKMKNIPNKTFYRREGFNRLWLRNSLITKSRVEDPVAETIVL
jgi:hypothetical protein